MASFHLKEEDGEKKPSSVAYLGFPELPEQM